MVKRYTYETSFPNPKLRFHMEHTAQETDPSIYQMHTHDFAELIIVRHGHGVHRIEDREFPLTAGDVFYISPNQIHGYHDLERIYICNIMFDPELYLPKASDMKNLPGFNALFHVEPRLRNEPNFNGRLHLSDERMLHIHDLINAIEEEYITSQPGHEFLVRCHFLVLVTSLARQLSTLQSAASREVLALSRVMTYIEHHYPEPIMLQDLAEIAHMSKNSLLRSFNRCYGASPIDYLNQYRLEKARDLLIGTSNNITDIAMSVGFSDSNYFGRKFKQAYKVSPRDYRKGVRTNTRIA